MCVANTKLHLFAFSIFALLAGFAVNGVKAEVIVKESTAYYPVIGKNGNELSESMLKGGKRNINLRHAIAATSTTYEIGDAEIEIDSQRCRVKKIEVIVEIKYVFPKWNASRQATPKLRTAWKKFYEELVRHEKTHGKIAKEGAKQLERELQRTSGTVALGCNDFGAFSEMRLNAIARLLKSRQDAFDMREDFITSRISRLQATLIDAQ
jgi:predicted secreted Zn-dependent protease